MLDDQSFAAPANPLATLGGADLASYGASNPFVSNTSSTPASAPPRDLISFAHNPVSTGAGAAAGGFEGVASHADVSGLDPSFASKAQALQAAAKAAGIKTSVLSGFRSRDQQAELYAKYQRGEGGIAAPPGHSYHETGNAVDMYADSPKGQQWLIDNAPKYGIYPGAHFGDPGHFQLAGNNPAHADFNSTPTPPVRAKNDAGTAGAEAPPASAASGAPNPKGLFTLALLQALAPMHKFSAVDYDPFKVQPK